jgi:L-lactate dehydrogenase complex protein LldE
VGSFGARPARRWGAQRAANLARTVRVALFVPCYVDQLRPSVGLAALDLLEQAGLEVEYPTAQTCCGQAFHTAGDEPSARALAERFVRVFADYDHVVTPSGSCAATVRNHYASLLGSRAREVATRTWELCEYLVEVVRAGLPSGRLDLRVGLHASCHALRGLRLGTPSETRAPPVRDPARVLLEGLEGIELVPLERADECCGFGGVFSVEEEAVSCRMGLDRLADHTRAGAEVVTSSDASCLLQLEALARRRGLPLRFLHVAELLAERRPA